MTLTNLIAYLVGFTFGAIAGLLLGSLIWRRPVRVSRLPYNKE